MIAKQYIPELESLSDGKATGGEGLMDGADDSEEWCICPQRYNTGRYLSQFNAYMA